MRNVIGLLFSAVLFSCGSSSKVNHPSKDTVNVAYVDSGKIKLTKAIMWIRKDRRFFDSNSLNAKTIVDTVYRLYVPLPTLDNLHKPKLDSLKRPILTLQFSSFYTDTSSSHWIHPLPW